MSKLKFKINELPRRKQRGIGCHSVLDTESSKFLWIPASAGMTNSPQAAGNTTLRDSKILTFDVWILFDIRTLTFELLPKRLP
jgi:hypothetical protein